MRFSQLTADFPGATNRLYERLERRRAGGARITDLVSGNVNEHGIVFPPDLLGEILARAAAGARIYRPDSLGQPAAREAIGRYSGVPAGSVLLTPGTSLSYWYAFKLLSEPGDEVLCPVPSYPLFDYIARLADVRIGSYRLDESRNWAIDMDSLEAAISDATRAIVVISPHNPTGMVTDSGQVEALAAIARRHALPVIADEVFGEFVYDGARAARPAETDAPLVLTLNGFSKMFALAGMKIGWIAVSGDGPLVRKSLRTLELIADTFLPVNEVAQRAVPEVFEGGKPFLARYRTEMNARRSQAMAALAPVRPVAPGGGFYIVVPCRRDVDEEDLAIELLEDEDVLVHPGYFYDIEGRHLVVAFVAPPDILSEALPRLAGHLQT